MSRLSPGRLASRLAPFRRTLGTTGGLVLATAVSGGTGFVFWWIAARQFPESAVGLAGAAVSAMLLLSQVSVLGLGTTMAGVLHNEPRAASMAAAALIAAGVAGAAVGLVFAGIAPLISDELAPLGSGLPMLLFGLGVSATAFSSVLDQVLVSVFRNRYQLLRNIIFAIGRLLLLAAGAVLIAPSGTVVYGAWVAGTIVSLLVVGLLPRNAAHLRHLRPLPWRRLRGMAFGALSHHILNLSRSSSVWVLPVLVTALISREANASFYVALLLANFISVVGTSATFTLYLVGARAPEMLWRQVRFTLALTASAAVLGAVGLTLGGRTVLAAFGPTYATAAYPALVLLALSTIPLVVKDHWIAVQRVQGGVGRAAVIGVTTLSVELGAAAVGALLGGVMGLALGRFAVLVLQALAMLPTVARALRPSADAGHLAAARQAPTSGEMPL